MPNTELAEELLQLEEADAWDEDARRGRRYVVRDGALVAWASDDPADGWRIIGAHTDSPNLRVRPRPDTGAAGFRQLGVEVYGGVLLNSWLDRDLGLSGRVALAGTDGRPELRLFRADEPLLRVPQLAIHLDRTVNSEGLRLDPQAHMVPLWGTGRAEEGDFARFLADRLDKLGVETELYRAGAVAGATVVIGEGDGIVFDWHPSLSSAAELMTAPRGTDPRLDLNPRRTTAQRRERYHERMDAKAEARAELESERLASFDDEDDE